MRVAVATIGTDVTPILNICDYFVVFSTDNGNIVEETRISARKHNAGYLAEQNINALIAGSMDEGSVKFFQERDILLYTSVSGTAVEAVEACVKNEIRPLPVRVTEEEPHECKNKDHDHDHE